MRNILSHQWVGKWLTVDINGKYYLDRYTFISKLQRGIQILVQFQAKKLDGSRCPSVPC